MSDIHPLNDLCKVEIQHDEYGFGGSDKESEGKESGILVELPDEFLYFGFNSFAFEDSFVAKEKLKVIYDRYQKLVGKRVYWTQYGERGNVVKESVSEGESSVTKTFAYVKLTSLIAFSDDSEDDAYNVNIRNGGSFAI